MKVYSIDIQYSYKKPNGLVLVHTDSLESKVPFKILERSIISIPPAEFGGNHSHPRSEAFLTFSNDLELIWKDDSGNIHSEIMMKGENLRLFIVEPHVPHVVVNRSLTHSATLFEYANGPQVDVISTDLLHLAVQ